MVLSQPQELDDIYTKVNILEKPTRLGRVDASEFTANFERFQLGSVRQGRVSASQAIDQHQKLLVLGKPGSGKTTLLKRMAMLCIKGEYLSHLVPIFISIKNWAEREDHPGALAYIESQWERCGIDNPKYVGTVLKKGRALVLFDGLDEIKYADQERISKEIRNFSSEFRNCQIVVTCRTSTLKWTFDHFAEIEVAEFTDTQIVEFSRLWFTARGHTDKAEIFIRRLSGDPPVKELASNPLLLTLLCSVFDEINDFPKNRSELYREGLDILLRKWDSSKIIEREEVYRDLSISNKYKLLSKLAFRTFSNNEYWFRQNTVKRYVKGYIRKFLTGRRASSLQLDIEGFLESIEAQHGVIVERYQGVYSFSHVTFQEFLAAVHIARSASKGTRKLKKLANHVTQARWHEVLLLTTEMLQSADELMLQMKEVIDSLLAEDEYLQQFLIWVRQKQVSSETVYASSAIRAFYFTLSIPIGDNLYRDFNLVHSLDSSFYKVLDLARDLDRNLELTTDTACFVKFSNDFEPGSGTDFVLDFDLVRALDRTHTAYCDASRTGALAHDMDHLASSSNVELQEELQKLRERLPAFEMDISELQQWWEESGRAWIQDFRDMVQAYRDIGHSWQFSQVQTEKLHQYHDATKLLVDCLNSDCCISPSVRGDIELSLITPCSDPFKSDRR